MTRGPVDLQAGEKRPCVMLSEAYALVASFAEQK